MDFYTSYSIILPNSPWCRCINGAHIVSCEQGSPGGLLKARKPLFPYLRISLHLPNRSTWTCTSSFAGTTLSGTTLSGTGEAGKGVGISVESLLSLSHSMPLYCHPGPYRILYPPTQPPLPPKSTRASSRCYRAETGCFCWWLGYMW